MLLVEKEFTKQLLVKKKKLNINLGSQKMSSSLENVGLWNSISEKLKSESKRIKKCPIVVCPIRLHNFKQ